MTFREFHNALRIMLNIDEDGYKAAGCDSELNPSSRWAAFEADPFKTFLRMPDRSALAIFAIIENWQNWQKGRRP